MGSYFAFCLKTYCTFKQLTPATKRARLRAYSPTALVRDFRAVKEDGLLVYRAAREYGVPQSMFKDSVHIVSKLSLIKSRCNGQFFHQSVFSPGKE